MKLRRVGFTNIEVVDREPFGLDRASEYPLFTPDLIELMNDLIPAERRDQIAMSLTVRAQNP